MSKILIAVTPMAGHVNPMIPVGRRLIDDGHEVYFQTSDIFSSQLEAAGLRFLPLLGNANYDYHKLGEIVPELRSAPPIEANVAYIKRVFADRIPQQYQGLRQVIAEKKIDLVLTDILFLGELPLLLSGEPRPPLISCGVIAPSWTDPGASIFTGPDDTPGGKERIKADNEKLLAMRAPGHRYTDTVLQELGVSVPGGFAPNPLYRLPDEFLQFGAEAFEYPMHDRPKNLTFVGPVLPANSAPKETPEWIKKLDPSLPVVLITQGTLANFDFDQLVNPALEGLAGEPVQVVVTAGGSKEGKIRSSANAIVQPYIPYELILPRTSVFVTNGGYNGVQQALTYGVPIVACGATEDKPLVAARVRWSGVGISIDGASATPEQVRDSVRTILGNPAYAERAKVVGKEIGKTDALGTISHIVRQAIAASHMSRF
jgi:MGT family glycosyltransferase